MVILHSRCYIFYKLTLIIVIILLLKSYPKYTIDRDIADNADKNRKNSEKHTGHM